MSHERKEGKAVGVGLVRGGEDWKRSGTAWPHMSGHDHGATSRAKGRRNRGGGTGEEAAPF